MFQGTTPTIEWALPFAASLVKECTVTFRQNGANIDELRKTKANCTLADEKISLVLTQEETLLLNLEYNVEIQLKVWTTDGATMATKPEKVRVCEIFDKEVFTE